ncbi:MAG: beta-hexosaminidase, partial [Clostridiales bacterium]|nr:beta-hexosaminidase [Clostridiales bacterium]
MDEDNPASLSNEAHRVLREKLDFDGIIVTDDLAMDAISKSYGVGESAVLAIEAGNDLICCSDIKDKYAALMSAVNSGRISEDRVDESVVRILKYKIELGIIEIQANYSK